MGAGLCAACPPKRLRSPKTGSENILITPARNLFACRLQPPRPFLASINACPWTMRDILAIGQGAVAPGAEDDDAVAAACLGRVAHAVGDCDELLQKRGQSEMARI